MDGISRQSNGLKSILTSPGNNGGNGRLESIQDEKMLPAVYPVERRQFDHRAGSQSLGHRQIQIGSAGRE